MDEYCGYDVEDVHSGTELDEVMCETCGTIQPAVNEMCSYCGTKLKNGGTKKSKKKCRKESGDYVPARKKINRRPAENSAAEKSVKLPKPVETSKPVLEKSEPIINPPRPAKSISRLRSQSAEGDTSAYADNENFTDNSDLENTAAKNFLKIFAGMSIVLTVFLYIVYVADIKRNNLQKKEPVDYTTPVKYLENGNIFFNHGDTELLVVGVDIPEGEYFLFSRELDSGRMAVGHSEVDDVICSADVSESLYLTLKEGETLGIRQCDLYWLEEPFELNNPYENSGMFKVGFDLEAGAYDVVPCGNGEQPCVRVHKESVYDMDSFLGNFLPENGKIKVKKGDYLELDNCILEKE